MNEKEKKGDVVVNACAVKPTIPFVTRKKIKKTPATLENRERVEFIDSHNFYFSIDKETGSLHCRVEKK